MKKSELTDFVAHIRFEDAWDNVEPMYYDGEGDPDEEEVEGVRVEVMDGPLAGRCGWLKLNKEN